jgi:hypothetical protein
MSNKEMPMAGNFGGTITANCAGTWIRIMKPLWTADLGTLQEEITSHLPLQRRILQKMSPLIPKPVFTNHMNIMLDNANCFRQIPYRSEVGCLHVTGDLWCSSVQNDPGSNPTNVTDLKTKLEQANQSSEFN